MIILGVDPGTVVTGYGIICVEGPYTRAVDYGCIKPPRKARLSERYLIIYEALEELIVKHNPDAVSVETQYVRKNPGSAIKLGMARGTAILAATKCGIPIFEYSPTKAKRAVVGNGAASKVQVQEMTKVLLNLREVPEPADAADALALALCHAQNIKGPTPATQI